MLDYTSFTRRGEWHLAVQLQAIIREAAEPLMWLAEHGGGESIRQHQVWLALNKLDAALSAYRRTRKRSIYGAKKWMEDKLRGQ